MARIASGTIVAALTAGALAVIGVLAWQASASPDHNGKARALATAGARPSASPSSTPSGKAAGLPSASGEGRRVVYSLAQKRVWLVGTDGRTERSFTVVPGSVSPQPGTYAVTSRSDRVTGTDGVAVEHVVRFGSVGGTTIGFSAAVNGSMPTPDPARRTGGVREKPADGDAMWHFALLGAKVVVVP
ncbi:hypothetical protein NGB36_19005 [Streptomyces sp. RB6PN25]|uniref:L,D-transpeptidase n=1 Tax=Streptomyces humicola TaxID=2953240 RepID=A0ABT1PY88_9ACTN|nr:hypothetical protein [Streptomyces humicola]MCQ4082636.1 hypothetical protein [Streptomyces humicola]